MCCGVSNVTKAQSVNANPSQSSWCTLFSSPWTSTTIRCFGLPAVSGFMDSYTLLSSPSTPTSIPTLLSAMSKQSPWSIQAASGSTLSALRWTPFAKVAKNNYLHWGWKMWSLPHVRPYPVPTCPWLNSWPTFPSFWWHPYISLMADMIVVFNPSSPLLGSLVATLVIASALAQLLYFSSLLWLTKMLSKWSSDNYVSDLYNYTLPSLQSRE